MSKQIDAQRNWEKKNIRLYSFSCNKTYDADIIKFMEQKENKYGYLRSLVRRDMEKENKRPTGNWIPVSERLPDKNGRYLITQGNARFKTILIKYYDLGKKEFGTWHELPFDDEEVWIEIVDVIAWMPLPEAYKEAENELLSLYRRSL